jgi:hypothetical protein
MPPTKYQPLIVTPFVMNDMTVMTMMVEHQKETVINKIGEYNKWLQNDYINYQVSGHTGNFDTLQARLNLLDAMYDLIKLMKKCNKTI